VQGKTAKYLVFGSDFVTYGAPFYKWCRFTYGAVTVVFNKMLAIYKICNLYLNRLPGGGFRTETDQ